MNYFRDLFPLSFFIFNVSIPLAMGVISKIALRCLKRNIK